MRTKYRKDTKKCPRCGKIALQSQRVCDECGLVFARLDEATNTEAKKQFFSKDKSVVMTSKLPSDVQKWRLLLFCGFLGIFGAHNLYVGRYYRGLYMLICGLFSVVYVSVLTYYSWGVELMQSTPILIFVGISVLMFVTDFIQVIFNRYKVPVALAREKWKQLLLE